MSEMVEAQHNSSLLLPKKKSNYWGEDLVNSGEMSGRRTDSKPPNTPIINFLLRFVVPPLLVVLALIVAIVRTLLMTVILILIFIACVLFKTFQSLLRSLWLLQDWDKVAYIKWIENRETHYERFAIGEMSFKC
jgi:hypothetical protein